MVTEFISQYVLAGGKIISGSDAGPSSGPTNLAGLAVHFEMEALVAAGLSPIQALLASTRWPAELLHWDKELGTIEPGKRADILIVDGNPLCDIRATRNIHTVIAAGRIVETDLNPDFRNPIPRPVAVGALIDLAIPELRSITPRGALAGGKRILLEIVGSGFNQRSSVRFDMTDLPTTPINDSKLLAEVGQSLLQRAGTYAVTVSNPGSGGGTSSAKYFIVRF